jgi:hypothetical protein
MGGGDDEPAVAERQPQEIAVEFGELRLIPPEGESWGEWVITRGVVDAEREERAIDHRAAYYIANFLKEFSTPALRKLAATGEVDLVALQEETTSLHAGQTGPVQNWMAWLAHYCRSRADRGPVENWRTDVEAEDRADVERLRRELILVMSDDLVQAVPPIQRVGNAGQPGWHGLVRHIDRPGGWIVSEGEPSERRVWETDSDAELEAAYVAVVEARRQWIEEKFGPTAGAGAQSVDGEQGGLPDDSLPPSAE